MKKKKRNNIIKSKDKQKGFSMVEILAVVVILGVLSTIGIVSVSRMIEKSRNHYYDAQTDQLILAAQSYANDNKNILPKNIGGISTIYLQELIDKKYIKEDIVDQNKKKCYTKDEVVNGKKVKGSRVDIYKSAKADYKYIGYLECEACQKYNATDNDYSCSENNKKDKPKIAISMIKLNAVSQGNSIYDNSNKINITLDAIDKTQSGYDKTVKISSYSYKIYVNGIVKYNSGLKINNKKDQIKIEDQLNKYIPGKVTVKVTVTNTLGQTATKSKSEDYRDATPPLCGEVTYEGQAPHKMKSYNLQTVNFSSLKCGSDDYKWIGLGHKPNTRQVWILCNDQLGVGCKQHEYSMNLVTEGHDDSIVLTDESNNTIKEQDKCMVKKCIDKTTPKIVVQVKNGSNANYTYTYDGQHKDAIYKPSDKNNYWLNKDNYPNGVTVEVTVSDTLSKLKSFTWYINDKEKKEGQEGEATNQKDNQTWAWNSGKTEYKHSINITADGVRKLVFTTKDHADNTTIYTLTLKIDRTAPPKPTIHMYRENNTTSTSKSSAYDNNTWTKKYVWVNTTHPTDNPNISGWKTNKYKTSGTVGTHSNVTGNDLHVNTQGISYVTFKACDVAGNCSGYVDPSKTIKEDRKDPVITYTVTSSGGTYGSSYKNYVNISVSCSDSYSGVKTFKVGGSSVSNPKAYSKSSRGTLSKSAYCKDNVGNDSSKSGSYKVVKYGQSGANCGYDTTQVSALGSTAANANPTCPSGYSPVGKVEHCPYDEGIDQKAYCLDCRKAKSCWY